MTDHEISKVIQMNLH